ncbi:MAG: hypothetical protein KF832_14320 [Caldilineaceae bacterium]|nr:hypothetical protein [Caldilineaceae bacterium]
MRTQYAYLATDQQTRPIGLRVVEPPPDTLQSARGRLYAVIEFAPTTPDAPQRVERALSTIQRTYYTIKGTQSYVLGEALREGLQQLLTDEQSSDQSADLGILLVALLENRLMAVGTGATLALFTNGGKVDVFPPGAIGFNEQGELAFDIYRQEAPLGTAFLIAGNYCLEYFSLRDLASTVAYLKPNNLSEIIVALCQHAGIEQLPGLFVITAADTPETKALTTPTAQSTPRRRWGGLPAALQAPPPQRPLATADTPPAARTGEAPVDGTVADPSPLMTSMTRAADQELTEHPLSTHTTAQGPTWQTTVQGAVQRAVSQTKTIFTKILPERATPGTQTPLDDLDLAEQHTLAEVPTYPQRSYTPAFPTPLADDESQPPAPAGMGMLERMATFTPPARAMGSRARLYILIALLILILTPVVVTAVYWSRDMRNQEEAERTLDLAETSFLAAENALQSGDRATARTQLTQAQTYLLAADNLVGGRLTRADELSVRIEREMAELLQVQPLYALAAPLVQFLPEALPQRVIVADQDIYVLDSGRQVIQYFQLDPTRTMVTNLEGEVVIRQGDTIDGGSVGELVDIAWQTPVAGIQDKAYLLVLDRNKNLFRYDRRVEGASRVALGGQDQLNKPIKMEVYADRLYIADAGASQLFRYSGDYTQPPVPWFNAQAQSDLTSLRAIDIDGDVWMLYVQGLVSRYRTGAQVPFSLEDSIGVIGSPVDIAVGDQGNSMVYLADSDQERILVYSKDGKYQRQYRAPEGHPLRELRGLFVDEVEDTMYILTQTALFKHPLTQAN